MLAIQRWIPENVLQLVWRHGLPGTPTSSQGACARPWLRGCRNTEMCPELPLTDPEGRRPGSSASVRNRPSCTSTKQSLQPELQAVETEVSQHQA